MSSKRTSEESETEKKYELQLVTIYKYDAFLHTHYVVNTRTLSHMWLFPKLKTTAELKVYLKIWKLS